jgi:hypothetical protein
VLRDFSWFQPAPRNFTVPKSRQRMWRRWAHGYHATSVFDLLKKIEAKREQVAFISSRGNHDVCWLLPFRSRFRRTIAKFKATYQQSEAEAIRYYMASCPAEMIPVCIWLLGRCCDRFHSYPISEFCRHQPSQLRKHVAKALRRLEEWWLLEDLARLYPPDERLQRFAKPTTTYRPFRQRLTQYVQSVDDSHAGEVATPSRMPYWAQESYWTYTPPKSASFIRRMLHRIRHWVRWGMS